MANGFIQLVAFVLMMAAAVMTICICVSPEWKTNDTQGEVIETIRRSQGLWISCMTMSSGHWQCDQYDQFFLGLPAPLQCARACVCMAMALQVSVWFEVVRKLISNSGHCIPCLIRWLRLHKPDLNIPGGWPGRDQQELEKETYAWSRHHQHCVRCFVGGRRLLLCRHCLGRVLLVWAGEIFHQLFIFNYFESIKFINVLIH